MYISQLNDLLDQAKKLRPQQLVVAVAEDRYILNAINRAKQLNLVNPIYVGDKTKLIKLFDELKLEYNDKEIIHETVPEAACKTAVKLVDEGKADILMKGLISTKTLLKLVVSDEFNLIDNSLLSHLAIFESPFYPKLLGVTDAAMNITPTLNEKVMIIENAVSVFNNLKIDTPKVALITAVEVVNSKLNATTDAAVIKVMNERGQIKNCLIDGPLALDNAISKEAAEHKGIKSQVAGDVDILVTPDLNSGNILYKSLAFLGNAKCAALITGAKIPIVLTSRSDNEETKFFSIVLGIIASNN